jgi:hypothetical protein
MMKMKRSVFWLGMLAMVLTFAMTAVGCDNGSTGNGGGPQVARYESTDAAGNTYTLTITGDGYILIITPAAGAGKTSSGTVVSSAGGVYTLQPAQPAAEPFTATVSNGGMTAITGTITLSNGEPEPAPAGSLTPVVTTPPVGGGEGGTFTITDIPSEYNGKYARLTSSLALRGPLYGCQSLDMSTQTAILSPIVNGSVSIPLWVHLGGGVIGVTRYSGNDTTQIFFDVDIFTSQTYIPQTDGGYVGVIKFTPVTFANGSATKSYNDREGGTPNPGTGGTFTLTNIPSEYNGKYAMLQGQSAGIIGVQTVDMSTQAYTLVLISNGSVSLPMWTIDNGNLVRYSGNATDVVGVRIYNEQTVSPPMPSVLGVAQFNSVTFANGSATKSYNDRVGGTPNPGTGGTFTLSGIPSQHNGKYAYVNLYGNGIDAAVIGGQSINVSAETVTLVAISNGSVSVPLWDTTNETNPVRYTGNANCSVSLVILTVQTLTGDNFDTSAIGYITFSGVAFSGGSASRAWSAGQWTGQ